jgi:uncharacterized protein (TIGR03435 family)
MKLAAAAIFCFAAAYAQTGDAKLSFEAVSLKIAPPPDSRGMRVGMQGGPGTKDPGRVAFESYPLSALIGAAYDMKWYQMPGSEAYDNARFNIIATLPPNSTKEQFRLMLQGLLTERFQVKAHKEKRETPVYALTIAKNGAKLKKAADDPAEADDETALNGPLPRDADGFPILSHGITMSAANNRARLGGHKLTMAWLADQLSGQSGRPVVDETGLAGEYDFTVSWVPNPNAPNAESLPDIFAAVQRQLGLKLEPKKGMIEVLIVDHAEKTPSGN